ncbi:MAG: hypothetical protein ACI3W8_07345 [Oscillospiraceae bacterium]
MTAQEALGRILRAYERYYDVNRETPAPPFAAEAVFHSHDRQFFLVKSATISEAESNEYAFFAVCGVLDPDTLRRLDEAAWGEGLSRVAPHKDHRNSDVTLVIAADSIPAETAALVKKLRRYKSYRFGLMGWTNYRIMALDCASGRLAFNRQGRTLKKLFQSIIKNQENLKEG